MISPKQKTDRFLKLVQIYVTTGLAFQISSLFSSQIKKRSKK